MQLRPNGHGLNEDRERVAAFASQPSLVGFSQLTRSAHSGLTRVEVGNEATPSFATPYALRPKGVIDAFVKVCQRWQLGEQQQLVLLGYGDNEFFGKQILLGRWLKAPQDVKDRSGYVVGISLGMGSIFNEVVEAELAWLNAVHVRLNGRSPMAVMLDGKMRSLMVVSALVTRERAL